MTALIISRRHRFVFLKTYKTAGTSIELALSRVCGPRDTITALAPPDEELRRAAGGPGPQRFRSPPLLRRVSGHGRAPEAREALGDADWQAMRKISVERNPWDTVVSLYFWHTRDDGADRVGFEEFVLDTPRITSLARKNAAVYRIDGEVAVDDLLRYEHLDGDLGRVWQELGLPGEPSLPRAKGGVRPTAAHYREVHTPRTAEFVATAFAEMIELLGYEF